MEFSIKKDCIHYKYGDCRLLHNTARTNKLNCEVCKCSFYETFEQYRERERKFYEAHPEYKLFNDGRSENV